ncbi:MAG: hypothetical protein ACO1SX_21055 [Actinomycetota bacterium]
MNRQITRIWAMALGLTLAVATAPAFAQGQGGQGRGGFRGRGVFSILRLAPPVQSRLNLNADQKTKIEAISDRLRTELRGVFQAGGDREAAIAKLRETNQKAEAEAVALLDATQKKQYEDLKTEAMGYAGLGGAGSALLAITDLTAEQKTKLKALATTAAQRPRPEPGGDRAAAAQARRTQSEADRTAVKAILTPAQQTQFDAAVAASRQRRPGQNNN